jgi:cobalt-zinc-cadmium efflux system membrane fusion protein
MRKRILASMALALLSAACKKEAAAVPEPEARVVEAGSGDLVSVARPDQYPLVTVEQKAALSELKATGVVAPDVNRTVPVNALLSGRVTAIRARLGDHVTKGQVLLNVVSPDLEMAFADYQKFQADQALSQKQFERTKLLYDHGAIAAKEVEVAQATLDKAKVDVKTSYERIKIQGGDPTKISSVFEVRAPVSGTITAQNTSSSAAVKTPDNSPDLFTISDLSRIWVLCDVYENLLSEVRLGDNANVRLNAYPDRDLHARVSNISQLLDPATRSAKVRLEMDNPRGNLKPGMFANVTFFSQHKVQRQTVPATAVIRLHDKSWVYRPDGQSRFKRVEVQAGALSNGEQEILGGLATGDKVVKNALALSSAGGES